MRTWRITAWRAGSSPLRNIVSAWIGENLTALAQARVVTKRNEVSAIRELLEILELNGAAVAINAMDCQVKTAERIRGHWGVESMHWSLDVTFGEDADAKREGYSADNFNTVRKMAMNVLKTDGSDYGKKRVSLKRRMFKAALADEYQAQLVSLL